MQTRQSASSQNLQIIRQSIENTEQESKKLDLYINDLQNPSTESLINPKDIQATKTCDQPLNQTASTIASTSLPNPTTTIQAVITPSVIPKPAKTPTAVAGASSRTIIQRPPINFCRPLVNLFKVISGSTDRSVEKCIVKVLSQIPIKTNPNILTHHIAVVKKYIKGSEHRLTVIAAIQVFVHSLKSDEQKSSQIMIELLRFFFNNQCVSKAIIFDWYKNGLYYGYPAFQNAKLWAKSFIDELNANIN